MGHAPRPSFEGRAILLVVVHDEDNLIELARDAKHTDWKHNNFSACRTPIIAPALAELWKSPSDLGDLV